MDHLDVERPRDVEYLTDVEHPMDVDRPMDLEHLDAGHLTDVEHPRGVEHLDANRPPDLATALARARSPRLPGPDTPAGAPVPAWPGPPFPLTEGGPADRLPGTLLRLSLAASDSTGRLRPASSAGALHPVDTVLVVGAGCTLPPGRYGYDPLRHRVHHLGRQPDGTPPGVTVELSVTARRTVSHYGHRAWPLLLLDTGHAAAALFLAARALGVDESELRLDGLDARGGLDGPDESDAPDARGGLDRPDGSDAPDARGGLGAPHAPHAPHGPTTTHAPDGPHGFQSPSPTPLAALHIPPPLHRPDGPPGFRPPRDAPTPEELLARRSAPPPLPGAPDPDALRAVLATAARAGGPDLRWCVAVGSPRPGLVELAADGATLRRIAAGEARPTLAVWAARQAWIADAGAVLLARGCPTDADEAHIRRAHLRAGFAVHLAHLTARRHGLAARPVGSWQQADLGAALGAPPGRDWIVHGLALGTLHADEENTT
ncbi:nitroreductase family protein [Streptomyces sp. NPDC016459]|uniref:nitroreductase family protein n=1 Tax=Streptomyces sp. NPDC016459 TaxID=3157190 RepID=UPI0033CCBEBB